MIHGRCLAQHVVPGKRSDNGTVVIATMFIFLSPREEN